MAPIAIDRQDRESSSLSPADAGCASTPSSDHSLQQMKFNFQVGSDDEKQPQTPRRAPSRGPGGEDGTKVSSNEDDTNGLFVFSAGRKDVDILPSVESPPAPVTRTSTPRKGTSTPSISMTPPPSLDRSQTAENERFQTDSPSILIHFQNMQISPIQASSRELALSPRNLKNRNITNALKTEDDDGENRLQSIQPYTPLTTPHRSPRARLSPRPGREYHRVEDEEPPSDAYHTAAFQRGLTKTKELMSDLTNVLESSSIHLEPDSTMKILHDRARKLTSFEPHTTRKVGFVGDSGVGKSSLLNCLLDRRGLARTTNNGTACTCVATEYYYHSGNDFVVEVDALTADELDSQSATLLRDYRLFHLQGKEIKDEEERKELEDRAKIALDTFNTMFDGRLSDPDSLLRKPENEVLAELVEWGKELRPSHVGGKRVLPSLEECSSLLMQLTAEQVSGEERRVWPFIRKIRVYLNAHILSTGLVLVDLPGLRDLNSARRVTTENYLRECHEIFAVCNIGRASTDAGVMSVFELARRARLDHVGIICTRSDDIRAEEAIKDWKGKKAQEIEKMMAASAKIREELEEIEEELGALDDRMPLNHEEENDRDQLLRERRALEKQCDSQNVRLRQYLVNNRNDAITHNLLQTYGDKTKGDVRVFCVSNTMYWENRDAPKAAATPMLKLCGILEVRKHCIALVGESQLRQATTYIRDETPSLLSDLELWVESGAGSISAEKKQSITQTLKAIESRLKTDLISNSSLADKFQTFMIKTFSNEIYEMSYAAFCRNWGKHATPAAGYHCWNEEAIESMVNDLSEPWKKIHTALARQECRIIAMVGEVWNWIEELLEGADDESSFTTISEAFSTRKNSLVAEIQTAFKEFDFKFGHLQTNALSGIRTSFIGHIMNDAYVTAMSENGAGSDSRRKRAVGGAFSDERTFETLMITFRGQFTAVINALANELKAIATAHFNDIRNTLDIVRSENVAQESERDSQFRERVARETRRLQEEMNQIKRTSIERSTPPEMQALIGTPSPARMLISPLRQLDPNGRETEGERHARLAFETDHPNGVIHITTSGEGRRCAWEALIGSFAARFPHLERPSQADFYRVLGRLAREHSHFGMGNGNMFRIDQMASVLFEWVRGQHGFNVQLGCLIPHPKRKYLPVLVPLDDDVEVEERLWVFNNDCREDEWEGAHFEGLADASVGFGRALSERSLTYF